MVTCNHMHLLVLDDGGCDIIPDSIQLIAGRTAQDYNNRKGPKGAFRQDRYHATAVESDIHLAWPAFLTRFSGESMEMLVISRHTSPSTPSA